MEKRIAKDTGRHINKGWVLNDGQEYFETEAGALKAVKEMGYKSIEAAYKDDVIYWTEWEEDQEEAGSIENNKLVAEFMVKGTPEEHVLKNDLKKAGTIESMQYQNSWDWLMPVAKKCLSVQNNSVEWDGICEALSTCDIEDVYKAVVKFIKSYNNNYKK